MRWNRRKLLLAAGSLSVAAAMLAACGSTNPAATSPITSSATTLSTLEKLYPWSAQDELPFYNNGEYADTWTYVGETSAVPLAVPMAERIMNPTTVAAWANATNVPWMGPWYVGTGLTPLERVAVWTAKLELALGTSTPTTAVYATAQGNVTEAAYRLIQAFAPNGPVSPAKETNTLLTNSVNSLFVGPQTPAWATVAGPGFVHTMEEHAPFVVHETANSVGVATCTPVPPNTPYNRSDKSLTTNQFARPARADAPLQIVGGGLWLVRHGKVVAEPDGPVGNPPSWVAPLACGGYR